MRKNRVDASALVVGDTGTAVRKQGVAAVVREAPGIYAIAFPPDRPIRPEAYHLSLTVLNKDTFRVAQFANAGGASIQVRIFDDGAMPADADFAFAAERV